MSSPRFTLIAALLLLTGGILHAELPPEAQTAVKKGLLAANRQDFPLAAMFFAEARELAPEAPELLYNLGLAESKIPGRELRAIVWFGAYLAANPGAPNAAAVKDQMDQLDATSQVNISRLLKAVADAANIVPEPDRSKPPGLVGSYAQGGSLQDAAILLVRNGNAGDALQLVAAIKETYWRSRGQGNIGLALSKAGDTRGAGKCYSLAMKTDSGPSYDLANTQARAGEIAAALKTAETLIRPGDARWGDKSFNLRKKAKVKASLDPTPQGGWESNYANCAIAEAMVVKGDLPGAKALLAKVERAANAMPEDKGDNTYKSDNYRDLGVALVHAGEVDQARQASDHVKVDSWKVDILAAIVRAQVRAQVNSGDFATAQKTTEQLTGYHKDNALSEITVAKLRLRAKSGDLEGAVKAARQLTKDKEDALQSLAIFQAGTGDFAGALKIVALIDAQYYYRRWAKAGVFAAQNQRQSASSTKDWIALNTELLDEPIFTDFKATVASLPSGSATETFKALRDAAESVLDIRELLTRMLKLQSQSQPKS